MVVCVWWRDDVIGLRHAAVRPPIILILIVCFCSAIYRTAAMMLCPVPEPCHCIGNDIIYCAYQRLEGLPYFMDFFEVWDKLNLSDNLISDIPAEGFATIKIRTLDLSRNLIADLGPDTFGGIQNLRCLDISHNQLRNIRGEVFAPLDRLLTLRLRYNRFRNVNRDAFTKLSALQELDLTGNEIATVPTDALKPLRNLRRLWLRNNRLKTIDAFAFPQIPIEMLDIGDNASPMRLDSEALCGLRPSISHAEPNVKEWSGMHTLLMDHNGISHLDACVVKLVWTLQKIDISGNPLRCDCRLYFLKLWGTRTTFPAAQCAEPFKYAGEYFESLQTHTFNCSQRDVIRNCDNLCQVEQVTQYARANKGSCHLLSFIILLTLLRCLGH